nr:hypothetical protein [Terriglobus saanensis]
MPSLRTQRTNRTGELITTSGYGEDVAALSGLFSQSLTKNRDALGETVLVHEGIGPDVFEQFFLGQDPAGVPDQVKQDVKGTPSQENRSLTPLESARNSIDLIIPELEYLRYFHSIEGLLSACQISSDLVTGIWKQQEPFC